MYNFEEFENTIIHQIQLNCNVNIKMLSNWSDIHNYIKCKYDNHDMLLSDVAIQIAEDNGLFKYKNKSV